MRAVSEADALTLSAYCRSSIAKQDFKAAIFFG
jgi:hypothetical protein